LKKLQIKDADSLKMSLESELKQERDKNYGVERDLNKEKREKVRLETKVTVLDNELQVSVKFVESQI
jgi:hypothetical protein